ncbi:hydrogenase nickel incorporation protein HypB [Leptolyngbya iicbica]|uniref:Hydrogenase accessory protein HypB n=2 Tax=Cyanophyceae TaxID=3028117 RepID=A0A4Q7EE89_9CYAN|nr:hydrogenase nickel incorporation protein HypB [Leptolyngbya sp. LK]RZM81791.1 hydrogenase accessory protein HypB [Leptolyngbya sp. LK]
MCVTCGCSDGAQATYTRPGAATTGATESPSHSHVLADGTVVTHSHDEHDHAPHEHAHHGNGHHQVSHPAIAIPAASQPSAETHALAHGTTLTLEQNLLAKNDRLATQNRDWFRAHSITALNLVSSPGAGKTTLLVRTIADLQAEIPITVIEGDQETANDAERIAATGCPTIQVNTGTGCHLEAAMIDRGLQALNPPDHSLVLIENVGNLVCPALFDLGEHAKVAMLSVTEGEDKPLKYPHMFRASQVMVLTKIDLLPYVNFDVQRCLDYARQVNPQLRIFQVSATTGAGLADWYDWLKATVQSAEA